MSEPMLRIQLSEITTVRVVCKKCNNGTVVEVPIDRLDTALNLGRCRFCNHAFTLMQQGSNPLDDLRRAFLEVKRLDAELAIEFEVPAP